MKVHKMFCVDSDVADFLKTINGSATVNMLLREYMEKDALDNMTEKDLERELEIIKLQNKMEKKIQKMRQNGTK